MTTLDIQFQKAVDLVRNAPDTNAPTDEVRLEFYGYYKQAVEGDVQDHAPSRFWFKARAKWTAWNALKGLAKDTAKHHYIQLVHQYMS